MHRPGWSECIVVASGPSLSPEIASKCSGKIIAVNDAWQMVPFADVLYACDERWWDNKDWSDFSGERWSSHEEGRSSNDKSACARRHGLNLVSGRDGKGFCLEPGVIHYGQNSGFQAVNLAMQFGAKRIRLLGFDMKSNGRTHFFGEHPEPLYNPDSSSLKSFRRAFEEAAEMLPAGIEIINCTPGSALTCFPRGEL